MRKIGAGCSRPRLFNQETELLPGWTRSAAPTLPTGRRQLNPRQETPEVFQRSAIGTYERGSGPV
jgi:hypothetical protein